MKLTKEGYFLIGLSPAILNHHPFFFINIVRVLTIFMVFGIAVNNSL